MANDVEDANSATAMVSQLETIAATFEEGLVERWANVGNVPADWDVFVTALGSHGLAPWSLALIGIAVFAVAQLVARAMAMLINRWFPNATGWRRGLVLLASALATVVLMVVLTRLTIGDQTIRTVARFWVLASVILDFARAGLAFILNEHKSDDKAGSATAIGAFVRSLTLVVTWALFGIALVSSMQLFAIGPGLRDFVGTALLSAPLLALLVVAYWRHRQTVSALILAPQADSRFRKRLAGAWPWIAMLVSVLTLAGAQAALTINAPLPPLATFLTLLLVLIAPHLDTVAADWAERGLGSPDIAVLVVAWRRTFRFVVLVMIFLLLAYFWVAPLFEAAGVKPPTIAARVAEVGFIILFSAFLWNAVGVLTGRVKIAEQRGREALEEAEPQSRLGTILPLIVGTSKAAILSIGILSVMIAVGINVLPILGGLSVFGLAIGFGSQTLVKDIVAGLFFLTDDAFRMGEYVETQGSKGTVEKISIRSVSLRNPRGPVAVVPYGQIGKVTNFSRGWVIEKYVFRVAFDTDVDLVRKLFKKIGQDVAANPELAADLLEPFKSQGIGMVEDGTLVLRGKFKARAGHQFAIKKAVLAAVQQAFTDNGIKAIPKPFV